MNAKHLRGTLMSAGTTFLMVATLGSGVAIADPGGTSGANGTTCAVSGANTTCTPQGTAMRDIMLVGSDTTENVMGNLADLANAFTSDGTATGTRLVGSFTATRTDGGTGNNALIRTKTGTDGAATPNDCVIVRPNGSGAGRTALINSLTNDPNVETTCLTGARSSSLDQTSAGANKLIYVPFGQENVTYARLSTSSIPNNLTIAQLTSLYTCGFGTTATSPHPMLPQAGSGTRKYWLGKIGVTEAQVTTNTLTFDASGNPTGGCVENGVDEFGATIEEHHGNQINNQEVAPFSVAQWSAQATGLITSFVGKTTLAVIVDSTGAKTNPFAANFVFHRELYNVFPQSVIAGTGTKATEIKSLFIGSGSKICSDPTAATEIFKLGITIPADCGATLPTA